MKRNDKKISAATKLLLVSVAMIVAASISACTPVAAWERGTLARPEMALDADPLETTLNNHIYFSKEASSGGNSASGGGCGCN